MNVFSLLSFLSFAICAYLAVHVLRLDVRSRTNQTFVGLCASMGIWSFAYTFVYPEHNDEVRWFWYRMSGIGWTTFAAFALHFFLTITDTRSVTRRPWLVALLYAPAVAFLIRLWTGTLLVEGFVSGPLGTLEVQVAGTPWHTAYSTFYLAYMVVGLGLVWLHGRRSNSPQQRRQARVIVLSGAASTLLGTLTNVALPTFGIHIVPAIAPMIILIWLFAISYSIARYRLMAPTLEVAVGEIISKIKDIIILTDGQGRVVQANEQATDLLGFPGQQLALRKVYDLACEPPELHRLLAPVLDGRSEGDVGDLDLQAREDKVVPTRVWTAPVRDGTGRLIGAVVIGHDLRPQRRLEQEVRERSVAEAALRKQNEHLGALHETTLHLIRRRELKDLLEGLVTRAAALVGASSGYVYLPAADDAASMELTVGTGPMAGHVGHRVRRGEGVSGQVWETGKPFVIEDYRSWDKRAKAFDQHDFRMVAGVPLRAADTVVGMIGLVHTDTSRRFGETELSVLDRFAGLASVALENARLYEALRDELARREKTAVKLGAARDAAEAASRAKSAFLATMSHELRTPLNAIIGYADMLEEQARDEGLDAYVKDLARIKSAGQHLLEIIQNILDFSRIEAGKLDLAEERFEPESIVREVAGMVEPLLRQHHNELVVRIHAPLGSMTGDPTRVRQSLHHLVSNAAKFTERGHVTIEATRETEGNRDWVVLLVKDDGAGMSEEQLRVALEAFQQVDSSATRKVGGTGLGLALTKQLCELMGGALEVDSGVGEGSTFKMRLPAAPATRASMDTIDFEIARG